MQNYNFSQNNSTVFRELTVYSLLKLNIYQVKLMSECDLPPHYYRYIPLFEEYLVMLDDGMKKNYIIAKLSETYDVSESTVKRVIKALSRRVTV